VKVKIWFPVIKGTSGTDVFTRRLADALRRRGIATEVTWFSTYYQFAPFLLSRVSPPSGTQIIHTNSWNGFAFKQPGIPLVVTEHLGVFDSRYRPFKGLAQHMYHETLIRRFVMASFQAASAITAVSQFTATGLANWASIYSAQVIYNWIDTTIFVPLERVKCSNQRPFRLLFVGNLSRRKGVDLLAPIMRELGPKFELHFTSGLRGLKTSLVTPNMIPLGRLTQDDALVKAYRHCDALLFPSRFEGFGLPVVEAMACGKSVIATDTSSLPEIVEDGVTGHLCPPDNIPAFVAACRKLADNPEILDQHGQAAIRRAEEIFSEDRIIPQYIALYEKLAAETGH